MPNRLLVVAASMSLAVPLGVALPTPGAEATGATAVATPLRSLGQASSPPLRSVPAQPVAAGRSEDAFPYRPVPHRRVPGALATDPGTIQTSASTSADAPTSGTGFAGNTNTDAVLPPDTNGDIGYDANGNAWYVQWVNLHYQMWERPAGQTTWTSKLTASGDTVFSALSNPCSYDNNGDPIVVFDRLAGRWILTQFAFDSNWLFGTPTPPYGQCVAVSKTGDPTGGYNLYSWDVGHFNNTDYFPDYPKLGVWPNGYYMTFNYFSGNNLNTFDGSGIVILDRNSMLAGQPANANASGPLGSSIGGMLPITVDDSTAPPASAPESLVAVDTNSTAGGSTLQWWHLDNVTWSPVSARLNQLADMTVATYNWDLCNLSRNCIPQPGTKAGLDTLSDRLMYRAGYRTVGGVSHVVLNHTVNVATSGTHAAVRWYDVTNVESTPALAQQGTYAPDATNRWMGSAAMDSAGDIAIGYSASSSSVYPSIRYAGRVSTDPAGTLEAESTLKAGAGSQTHSSNRWGDYSSLVVDPRDGCTFWYTNEYYSSTSSYSWRTWIGSFSFPNCGSGGTTQKPLPPTNLTGSPTAGTTDQIDLSWSASTGATSYNIYRDGSPIASSVTTTSYHDSGLSAGTTYNYGVSAVNTGGESAQATTSVTTNSSTSSPPGTFTLSGTATSKSSISLSWTSAAPDASYTVWRRAGNKGNYSCLAGCAPTGSRSYTDTSVSAGTTYSYYVVATNSTGSSQSNTINVRTPRK